MLKKLFLLAALAAPFAVTGQTSAQERDFSKVQITTKDLGEGVYAMFGAGGNLGVSAGADGVFLIDDQFAPLSPKIKAAISKISDKPVKFLINTHWHFDHTGGNENFGKEGTIIVAHDNVRKLMSEDQMIDFFKAKIPAAPKAALPVITFKDRTTFHLNDDTIVVQHMPAGHTSGDSIIYFHKADVLHTGDLFFNGIYPFIDVQHGGSLEGMIADAGLLLEMVRDDTQIIPGHGPLAKKPELMAFQNMLITVRDNVKKLIAEGKTREQVIAAKPTASLDEKWGSGFLKPDAFTGIAYDSLK